MEKLKFIKDAKSSARGVVWQFSLQGLLLIFIGVLIIIYPELLILFFSFAFILVGFGFLWAAFKIRRFVKKFESFFDLFG